MTNLLLKLPTELLVPLLEKFVLDEDLVSLGNLACTCRYLRNSIHSLLWYIRKYVKHKYPELFVRNRTSSNGYLSSIAYIYKPNFDRYPIDITNITQYRNFFVKPYPLRRLKHDIVPRNKLQKVDYHGLSQESLDGFFDYYRSNAQLGKCTTCIYFVNNKPVGWSSMYEHHYQPYVLHFYDPPVYTDSELEFATHICSDTNKIALIYFEHDYGPRNVHRHYYTKYDVILYNITKSASK